jgi:hypothetical protein
MFAFARRYGIIATAAPWVAADDSFGREITAIKQSVRLERL